MTSSLRLTVVIIFSLFFLAGCAKTHTSEEMMDAPTESDANESTEAEESGLVEVGLDDASEEQMSLLELNTVYFDFDEAIVTEQAQKLIRAHAELLAANPDVDLHLAGHADERGTREYNLALGDQRAQAVSAFFQEFGVDASRITTVSFGEEMPAVAMSDEDAWALNRRVEMTHDLLK